RYTTWCLQIPYKSLANTANFWDADCKIVTWISHYMLHLPPAFQSLDPSWEMKERVVTSLVR
ncbi:hypothetical protein SK128_022358, partial [Halocaridina rubra]